MTAKKPARAGTAADDRTLKGFAKKNMRVQARHVLGAGEMTPANESRGRELAGYQTSLIGRPKCAEDDNYLSEQYMKYLHFTLIYLNVYA
jgi:hypothetical protein